MNRTRESHAPPPASPATDDPLGRADSTAIVTVGDLLEFVAPGVVHGLGNALFAIRGGLHAMDPARAPIEVREQGASQFERGHVVVSQGYYRALGPLEILRRITATPGDERAEPWLSLLAGVVRCAQIPLRERGQVLDTRVGDCEFGEWDDLTPPQLPTTPGFADPTTVVRAVSATLIQVSRAMPSPGPECIRLRLADPPTAASEWATLRVDATATDAPLEPPSLPFQLDVTRLADSLARSLVSLLGDRAGCTSVDGALFLKVRLARPRSGDRTLPTPHSE